MLARVSIRSPSAASGGGIGSRSSISQPASLDVTAAEDLGDRAVGLAVALGPDADDRADRLVERRDPHRRRDRVVVDVDLEAAYADGREPRVQVRVAQRGGEVVAPGGVHQLGHAATVPGRLPSTGRGSTAAVHRTRGAGGSGRRRPRKASEVRNQSSGGVRCTTRTTTASASPSSRRSTRTEAALVGRAGRRRRRSAPGVAGAAEPPVAVAAVRRRLLPGAGVAAAPGRGVPTRRRGCGS